MQSFNLTVSKWMLDIRTDQSKAVLLGRRKLYAVPSRSPAKMAIFGITPWTLNFVDCASVFAFSGNGKFMIQGQLLTHISTSYFCATYANSADPDQTLQNASGQSLHTVTLTEYSIKIKNKNITRKPLKKEMDWST